MKAKRISLRGPGRAARRREKGLFRDEGRAFVTSQDSGEAPFEVWRLPEAIAQHIDGLLLLYLGDEQGEALARSRLGPSVRDGR
jgi:hypothetical protein